MANFYVYMRSDRGGKASAKRAAEYSRRVHRYLVFHGATDAPLGCLNADSVEQYNDLPRQRHKSDSWKRGTIYFVARFIDFLITKKKAPAELEDTFRRETKGMSKVLLAEMKHTSAVKMSRTRNKLQNIDIESLYKNDCMVDAIKSLSTAVDANNIHMVKHLIARMVISSGARAGAISGMLISEIENAEQCRQGGKTYHVVSVAEHKTTISGAVQVPLAQREYKALLNVCQYAKSVHPGTKYPFVSANGKPFDSSRINHELNSSWRMTGMLEKHGPITTTENRKRIATVLGQRFPELRERIAKQLKHSVATERACYDLATGAQNAVYLATLMRPSFGSSSCGSNDPVTVPKRPAVSTYPNPYNDDPHENLPAPEQLPNSPPALPAPPVVATPGCSYAYLAVTNSPPASPSDPMVKPLTVIQSSGSSNAPVPSGISSSSNSATSYSPAPNVENVRRWLDAMPDENAMTYTQNTVFQSASPVIYNATGKTGTRRVWSSHALANFRRDWATEIESSAISNKKPKISQIKMILHSHHSLQQTWWEMSPQNIRDKIFHEARKLRTTRGLEAPPSSPL
jgi:hypothetical protein